MSKRARTTVYLEPHATYDDPRRRGGGSVRPTQSRSSEDSQRVPIHGPGRELGALAVERKFYDTKLIAAAIQSTTDATGGMHDPSATSMISTPAQGDGEQNRDGKRISILSVEVNGYVYSSRSSINASTTYMISLVLDKQTNGAQCTSEQIFKNYIGVQDGSVVPLRNLLYSSRFQVLKTELITVDHPVTWTGSAVETQYVLRPFKIFVRFPKGLIVNFNSGTTADIGNVIDNSLHVVVWKTYYNTSNLNYNARIRFVG